MADGGHRLARFEHRHEEVHGRGVGPQVVGVGHAARQDHGVVVVGTGPLGDLVDREAVGAVEVAHGLDHPGLRGHQLGRPAGVDDGPPGPQQLDLLNALVRHDEGDPLIPQFVGHPSDLLSPLGTARTLRHRPPRSTRAVTPGPAEHGRLADPDFENGYTGA